MRKLPPSPWKLTWQTNPNTGRRSRFELKDAKGRTIGKFRNENAARMAEKLPQLFSLVHRLSDTANIWRIILSKEFGHDVTEPYPSIDEAMELLHRIRCDFLLEDPCTH